MRDISIRCWKSLASIIHPPLPLNSRDSQRLLSLLNASFAEALDKEHPKVSPGGKNTTDQHMHSILSSPIFGPRSPAVAAPNVQSPASPSPTRPSSTRTSEALNRGEARSILIANAMIKQNVESLKQHIAAGTADLQRVSAHLRRAGELIPFAYDTQDSWEARSSKSHGMGSLVLSWLWSSGLEYSDKILLNRSFLVRVIPFLALEGRLAQAMQWFQYLGTKVASLQYPRRLELNELYINVERSQAMLLNALRSLTTRHSSLQMHISMEKYMKTFAPGSLLSVWLGRSGWMNGEVRKVQRAILQQMVICALDPNTNGCLHKGIQVFLQGINAAHLTDDYFCNQELVFECTGDLIVSRIEAGEAKGEVDSSDYDAFSRTVSQWSRTSQLLTSILKLHHPTDPDWDHAYQFFLRRTPLRCQMSLEHVRRRTVRLGLDVTHKLLSSTQPKAKDQAKQLMEVLQDHFEQELGILQNPTVVERRRQKADHLNLVDTEFAVAV